MRTGRNGTNDLSLPGAGDSRVPDTSCTSTLAPCSFSSSLDFSACSPSVGWGASRRGVDDANERVIDERADAGPTGRAMDGTRRACREARSKLDMYILVQYGA